MAPILGYWEVRGITANIKYMLKYLNVPYEEKLYKFGPKPDYSLEDWLKEKYSLGLAFPNLPYYIDGDVKITQSKAIMRYLARKYNLMGKTELENIRIDIIEREVEDFRQQLRKIIYSGPDANFDQLKEEYFPLMRQELVRISAFLGDNDWMSGGGLSYVDFWVYDIIDWNRLLKEDCLNGLDNLIQYMDRVENLPGLKKYLNSNQFSRFPIFAPWAKFGG